MSKIYKEIERGIHDIKPVALQFDDFSSVAVATSPYGDGVAIFKNGTGDDLSSTHMPTGTAAVAGNIFTTAPITSLVGGNFYIVSVTVTVNGTSQQEQAFVKINCVNEKSGLMRSR